MESDLIRKLKSGDQKRFKNLFMDNYASLCEYSARITGSKEAAEGVVQDVFASLWESRMKLDDKTKIKAFLFHSVKNRSLDIVQYEQIRRKHKQEIIHLYKEYKEGGGDSTRESRLMIRVHEEVERLPEKCKEAWLLHRKEGLTHPEIAQILEITVKAVEARMAKALKILRENLSNEIDIDIHPTIFPLLLIFF
ncbi:MAG: RNA polymerase sigma-70 factor [Balneolaceae bacterium]|nr:RNA polymerase sigma-70 factor [Balneolaceae bacterium]